MNYICTCSHCTVCCVFCIHLCCLTHEKNSIFIFKMLTILFIEVLIYFHCCANLCVSLQFFQWADGNGSVGLHITAGSKVRLTDAASVTAHLRQHHVMFYCQCQFLQKSMESILGHFKNVSWSFKYLSTLI